jgi:hypothetical protein
MAIQLTKPGDTITVKDSDLVPNGDPGTEYDLQLLTREVYRDIHKRHTRKRPNRTTRAMEDETDYPAVQDDLIDFCLTGWRGVLDGGVPAELTRDNKLLLDGQRTQAMLELAGMSQIAQAADQKGQSFRSPA